MSFPSWTLLAQSVLTGVFAGAFTLDSVYAAKDVDGKAGVAVISLRDGWEGAGPLPKKLSPLPWGEGLGEGGRLLRKQFGDLIPSILRKGLKLTAVME